MPQYLYRNPKTGEIVEVVQRMTEPHVYNVNGVQFERVFTIPQGATDTVIDPMSSKEFSEKMGRKKCKYGDFLDESAAASKKREEKMGIDPIKQRYLDNYSKKRKGKKHPSLWNDNTTIEVSF